MFLRLKNSLVLVGALVLFSPLDSFLNTHFITGASAESEASSEAASEAPMTGGRRRRGYRRYQQQQQRMAGQQARQQLPNQQQRRRNGGGAQRNKPFKASDYIHEYGSGRSKGHFNRQNFSGGGSPSANPSSNNLPSSNSVPFQKFPPK